MGSAVTLGQDEQLMGEAIALASLYRPSPNPRVGAVIVKSGEVVGRGAHRAAGSAHAEVIALAEAGTNARGATAYVTLEPCAHVGRTGPCVQALIDAGVNRVVFAHEDPNPIARGGAEHLRAAGVDVVVGVLADEAASLNRGWIKMITTGRPWVTWKVATTLDGRTAADDGSSKWITGTGARRDVHRLRATVDAIVTGTGTALTDDPRLDVRDLEVERQPLRVVVGDRQIPTQMHLAAADVLRFPHQDPTVVLKHLVEQGVTSVLLECGPTLAAAFMRAGVIDEVVAYVAPALLGSGRPMMENLGIGTMHEIVRLKLRDAQIVDGDVRITAEVIDVHRHR